MVKRISSILGAGLGSVVLTAISAGTNVSYSWDFGDGSGGDGQVVSHTYGMIGNNTVTATNSVGVVIETAVVVVLEEPTWEVYMPVARKP